MKININVDRDDLCQPDPYIIKANGFFYIYVTGAWGVHLYKSKDMKEWDYLGICYQKEGEYEYWAPSVIQIGDKFFMYVSTMKTDSEDVHTQRIQVIESSDPEKGWKYVCELLPPFSIDAHVVNTDSGLYIFYCNNDYDSVRAGTYILVDKMPTPYEVEGKPVPVVKPSLDEEIYQKDRFKKGLHWHTIEGAFYFKEGDYHYCMYSGSAFEKETYFIGYAVARGDVDDLRKLDFKKYPDENTYKPVLKKNDFQEGTGHNSVIKENGKYYIVYHGRDTDKSNLPSGGDKRTFRIDEMSVENGVITVNPIR